MGESLMRVGAEYGTFDVGVPRLPPPGRRFASPTSPKTSLGEVKQVDSRATSPPSGQSGAIAAAEGSIHTMGGPNAEAPSIWLHAAPGFDLRSASGVALVTASVVRSPVKREYQGVTDLRIGHFGGLPAARKRTGETPAQ